MKIRNACILLLALVGGANLHAQTAPKSAQELVVPLVTYYDYAPFSLVDESSDLTRDLARLLTQESGGRYRFETAVLPKGRLDLKLQNKDWQGVVAWLHPRFVQDEAKTKYLWTEPLVQESDLVVSHVDAPVEFTGIASLKGKVLGTVVNQRYADVEDMVARGELLVDTAPSQESNLKKLMLKRVDVVFVSRSTLSWFRQRIPKFDSVLHIAELPRNRFTRHLMLTPDLPPELIAYVQGKVAALGKNPSWRDVMKRHHLEAQMPAPLGKH